MSELMTRREAALHGLKAEFMSRADVGEWFPLPGGESEGRRLPDGPGFVGNWLERELAESRD